MEVDENNNDIAAEHEQRVEQDNERYSSTSYT